MNTKIKRWTARIVGIAALPTLLTLGLGGLAPAGAESTAVTTHTTSTQHVRPADQSWTPVYYSYSYSQAAYWNYYYNNGYYDTYIYYYSYYGGYYNVWVVFWYE